MPDISATAAFAPDESCFGEALDSQSLDRHEWLAVFRDDQRQRWRRGERIPAEVYLERCAALGVDAEGVLNLIYNEVLIREESGEAVSFDEYLRRFPAYEAPLRRRFALHQAVASGSIRLAPTGTTEKGASDATLVDGPPDGPGAPAVAAASPTRPPNDQTIQLDSAVQPSSGHVVRVEGVTQFEPAPTEHDEVAAPTLPQTLALPASVAAPAAGTAVPLPPEGQTVQFDSAAVPGDLPLLAGASGLCPPPTQKDLSSGAMNGAATEVTAPQTVAFEVDAHATGEATAPDLGAGTLATYGSRRPVALPIGTQVPGYEILGILGKGGMGVVYKARQLGLNRLVALKMILHADHANAEDRERFRTEAEAVARLQHPNIVQIHEIGQQNGLPYFSLEFCPGGTLAGKLDGTPLSPPAAAQLILTLARAIQVAHENKIVHRDLKPANVLLTADGQHKITDFGLAKKLDEEGQTQSGMIMGTPSYMAPEQAAGKVNDIGPATDVYSLGAILYELLTGRPPFKGTTAMDTVLQVMDEEPISPRQIQSKTPRDLETICLKAMDKTAGKRYASAGELADDLRRFLDAEPIHARPTPLWERGVKWARRRPAVAGLVAAITLGALALLVLGWWSYASIQTQLTRTEQEHARAEQERADKEAEQKSAAERRATATAVYHRSLTEGQDAMRRKNYTEAVTHFEGALKAIASDPALAHLHADADKRRLEARALVDEATAREAAGQEFKQFTHYKDEALFHGTQVAGLDLAAGRGAARKAAQKALELVKLDGPSPRFAPDRHLTKEQREEILTGCYELLLLLAEVEATAADGRKDDASRAAVALGLLDQARGLGLADSRAYHLRRARYLALAGKAANARKELATAKGIRPSTSIDHFFLGDELYRQGNVKQAAAAFEYALRLDPDHFWAQYFLAACDLKQEHFAEAKAGLIACLSRRPGFVWIHLLLGHAHGGLGEFDLAEADYQKALQLEQAHPDRYARYGIFLNRGAMRLVQGKVPAAIADFEEARKLLPGEYQAYLNLAIAYQKQKDLPKAASHLKEALGRVPDRPSLYRRRALLSLDRSDRPAALADFNKAITLELPSTSDWVQDHIETGRILYQMKKYDKALEALDAALKVTPDSPKALLLRAEALLALGQFKGAEAAYTVYLKHTKVPDVVAYTGRSVARRAQGNYAGAVEDYTRSLELEPAAANMHIRRGWAYALQALPLALRDFDAAIQSNDKDGDAYTGRGFVQAKLGRPAEAVADAEKALRCRGLKPAHRVNIACVFAQAAARSADKEVVALWKARAVNVLDQALEGKPAAERAAFWRRNVEADPELDPIRDLPAYARLKARYGAAPK